MAYTTIAQALRETLYQQMVRDERVFILGQDVGIFGGAFRVTEGLYEKFGPAWVRDTAISEIAIAGLADGRGADGAASGGRVPICRFYDQCHGSDL